MAKEPMKWESEIEEKTYSFSYIKEKQQHVITVNNQPINLKPSFKSSILGFDEPFSFDGINARLVVSNKQPDVAVNGTFLQSKKAYVAAPLWVLIFVLPCFILLITGGALGGAFGAVGFMSCISLSKKNMPIVVKPILCIAVVGLVWLLYFIIVALLFG